MTLLADTTLRLSIVVLAALAAAWLLRRRSAALRHWVLAMGIACAALVPVLETALPSWHVGPPLAPAGGPRDARVTMEMSVPGATAGTPKPMPRAAASARPGNTAGGPAFPVAGAIVGAWAIGALIALSRLLAGLRRVSRMASSARPLSDPRLAAIALEIGRGLGLRRPVTFLESRDPAALVTWGAVRARIVLPPDARRWSDDRSRVVLRHELAHVARGDWLAQMLAEILSAVYWFDPLVWIACRRLRCESERACDDEVLTAGVDAADYAAHLLALARTAARPARPALAMARPSSLEGRVTAMLNASVSRRPLRDVPRIAIVVAFLALTVPLAVAQARFSALGGTVSDQTNRFVPGVTLVLTNAATQAKYEIRTDATGRFQFVGLPSGDYQLEARQPGFKSYRSTVNIAGTDVTRPIQLQIGGVQETIRVASVPADAAERQVTTRKARDRAEAARRRADETCGGDAASDTTGGRIVPPTKLVDTRPAYPDSLRAAGIAGTVTLDALIGTDGSVRDVTVVSSPDPDLGRLAADAVRQWQFSTTYLNCTPVELPMRVTVGFER